MKTESVAFVEGSVFLSALFFCAGQISSADWFCLDFFFFW